MSDGSKGGIAKLALEDGSVFTGTAFGARREVDGEVCFNTSMTGYQEILTDPSYRGQIVCMTYPEIGNYGVNSEDVESSGAHLAGFIVRELSRRSSNFRSEGGLDEYLERHGIPGIAGIDTRALVRRLRSGGAMKGVLSSSDLNDESLVAKAKASPGLVGRDLVREVIPSESTTWNEKLHALARQDVAGTAPPSVVGNGANGSHSDENFHVVALELRNEVEHCAAFGRNGLPRDGTARHGDGR